MTAPALLLTVDEAGEALGGIGRGRVYDLLKDGALPSVKIGRRRRIRAADLQAYVESLPTDTPQQNRAGATAQ